MELQAELTQKDQQFLEQSLNGPMWKVILQIGTPLALYQLLSQAFTILDTMMAAHISEESVSAVAYLAQLNAILGEASVGVVMMVSNTSVAGGGRGHGGGGHPPVQALLRDGIIVSFSSFCIFSSPVKRALSGFCVARTAPFSAMPAAGGRAFLGWIFTAGRCILKIEAEPARRMKGAVNHVEYAEKGVLGPL